MCCYFICASPCIDASAVAQFYKGKVGCVERWVFSAGYVVLVTSLELDGATAKDMMREEFGVVNHVTAKRVICLWIY
jgi:hypothetical protein